MPLTILTFDLYLAPDGIDLEKAVETGDYTTHRLSVFHADKVLAEKEARSLAIGAMEGMAINYATLWCWAAMRRIGADVPKFPLFWPRVIDVQKVAGDEVDPTNPGQPTGSP